MADALGSRFVGQRGVVRHPLVRVGVDASTEREQDVLVAPDDTFRHPGRAARVQDVVVIGRSGSVRSVRQRGVGHLVEQHRSEGCDVLAAAVVDGDEVAEPGCSVAHRRDLGRIGAGIDEPDEIGVVEEVQQFVLDIPEVDVDRDRSDLERGEHRDDPLDGVLPVDPDVVTVPEALAQEVVRQAVGPLIQLREGEPSRTRSPAPCDPARHRPRTRTGPRC